MKIQTRYYNEKTWRDTDESELLRMIEEEVGDADPKGILLYIKETIKNGKLITVGECKFKAKEE